MAEDRPQATPMSIGVTPSYRTAVSGPSLVNGRTVSQEKVNPLQYANGTYHDQATGETFESSRGHAVYTSSDAPPAIRVDPASSTSGAPAGVVPAAGTISQLETDRPDLRRGSSSETLTGAAAERPEDVPATTQVSQAEPRRSSSTTSISTASSTTEEDAPTKGDFMPIKSAKTAEDPQRPGLVKRKSIATEEDLFKALSRRRTATSDIDPDEERNEVEKLMSRMFGHERQEAAEEKTRHAGVCWRDLNVVGVGLGASLQPTVGDIFLGLPRFIKNLVTKGPKAATGKPPTRKLLSDFNGCVRPGEMLLVLGRPGAGCSTFLKTFCNQRAGFEEVTGDVTYGGTDAKKMAKNYRGEIIYNPEDDLHYATLSVRRTLKFALQTRAPGKESRLEGESKADYIKEFMRVATKLLWIEHTLGTKVGSEYVRGVSGGERKRVSIAEALITRASIQGWDNSSKGLDASTAVEYVTSLRTLTNMAQVSTAVSLYQASETITSLFDKILLIHEGQVLYFGPSDDAKQYFIDMGFECPERWTTADFLTAVTDEHERTIKKGCEDRIPRSTSDFADAYRKSDAYKKTLDDMKDFEASLEHMRRERVENQTKETKKKNYEISFPQQVLACTQRQFLVMVGDKASLIGKWGGIVVQSLIVGSLFFNLPTSSSGAFTRGGVIFFILLFNALLALAEQTSAFESKPILLKHKTFQFYRPAAYALAQTVVDIPLVLIQVLLFDIIIYWMAGLSATASQFFISVLTLWMVTMVTYSFFRAISAVFKTLDDATKVTGIAIQILVVYTGYLIPPVQMPVWFGWLRWINWLQYGFEMLLSNEFAGLEMQCEPPYLVPTIGPGLASQYQSCALAGSTPGSTTVDGSAYILQSFQYSRSHLWRNFGFLWAFFFFFVAITCIGMEGMKPNAGGAALTLYKRGQVPKNVEEAIETGGRKGATDEENLNEKDSPEKAITSSESDKPEEEGDVNTENLAKNDTVFTFQDINYTIPYEGGSRKLLQGVQGMVRPGKLTALMGASGAGKTTLLNILAQRVSFGNIDGTFLVDGRPLPKSFQRATGFAEQMDVHEATSTVREALQFSALLRQPREVSTEEKYEYCETIIDLLEMRDIAGATIGKIGEGLNTEQRKRLTIGVELASKPELLFFLDEPTSGLDSSAAFNIVRFLRKLADAGQAVLCTIHQPSAILFDTFDELVLLKSGGRVVYAGELGKDSKNLREYFQQNGGDKCPPDANPAEWMLEQIGAGDPDYNGPDWGDKWVESEAYKQQTKEIEETIEKRKNAELSKNLKDDREFAMPLSTQTIAVIRRSFTSFWRTPNYLMGIFFLHILTGLFNCFTFYHLGFASIDFQSRLFSIFMTLTISPPLIQQLQPVFLASRNIFQSREEKAKIYSWIAWVTGAVLVEIPYRLLAGAIYFCCWWWGPVGYRVSGSASGYVFLMLLLFELWYTSFGQFVAAFSPNDLLASLLVPLLFLFVVSFCGVVVPPENMPYFWRSWMYRVSPFTYLLEGFLGVTIHDQPVICSPGEFARFAAPPGQTCVSYTAEFIQQMGGYVQTGEGGLCEYCQYENGDQFGRGFSVYYSHRWRNMGIFVAFILFNYAVVYVCTYLRFRAKNPLKDPIRKIMEKTISKKKG